MKWNQLIYCALNWTTKLLYGRTINLTIRSLYVTREIEVEFLMKSADEWNSLDAGAIA